MLIKTEEWNFLVDYMLQNNQFGYANFFNSFLQIHKLIVANNPPSAFLCDIIPTSVSRRSRDKYRVVSDL